MYYHSSLLTGLMPSLSRSLEVFLEIGTDELREKNADLWASVQASYGIALQLSAEKRNDEASLMRGLGAFTHALEVWTPEFPLQRSATLNSLATALMTLGTMQNASDCYVTAIEHLRSAKALLSDRRNSRIWWAIETNIAAALSLLGDNDPKRSNEAISILRRIKERLPTSDVGLHSKLSLNLARALMFAGRDTDNRKLLHESRMLVEEILHSTTIPDIRTEALSVLGLTFRHLGIQEDDVSYLEKSQQTFEKLVRQDPPLASAALITVLQNLALTLKELGTKQTAIAPLNDSIITLLKALELTSKKTSPKSWAIMHFYLAGCQFELLKLEQTPQNLENAQFSISEALAILGPADHGPVAKEARRLGDEIGAMEEGIRS